MRYLLLILLCFLTIKGYSQKFDYSASIETGVYKENIYNMYYGSLNGNIILYKRLNIEIRTITTFFGDYDSYMNPINIYKTDLSYDFKDIPITLGWKYKPSYNQFYMKLKIIE